MTLIGTQACRSPPVMPSSQIFHKVIDSWGNSEQAPHQQVKQWIFHWGERSEPLTCGENGKLFIHVYNLCSFIYCIYRSLRKHALPTLFCILLCGRSVEGAFAQIFSAYIPTSVPCNQIRAKVDNRAMTATAFRKNASFNERVLQEISGACVVLSQEASKQLASSMVTEDSSLRFQCGLQKPWGWPANKAEVILCVRAYEHN